MYSAFRCVSGRSPQTQLRKSRTTMENEPLLITPCARGAVPHLQSLFFCSLYFCLPPFLPDAYFWSLPSCCLCSYLPPSLPRTVSLSLLGLLLLLCHWEDKRCYLPSWMPMHLPCQPLTVVVAIFGCVRHVSSAAPRLSSFLRRRSAYNATRQ